jgi:hypothetical protein
MAGQLAHDIEVSTLLQQLSDKRPAQIVGGEIAYVRDRS